MDHHAIPEHAIRSFERLHGLLVTVHDLGHGLAPFLLPERGRHRHPMCVAFRDGGHFHACTGFDVVRLRQEAEFHRAGRLHRCPAGLVEWVVPVFGATGLRFVLFAGVVAEDGLEGLLGASARLVERSPVKPPVIDPGRAEAVLEALNQLAARLAAWSADGATGQLPAAPAASAQAPALDRRRGQVRRYIYEYYAEPLAVADLARHLGLSPSRTRAVVAEACGASFVDLLTEARLASAVDLLRHTDLPVADIAVRCGFTDASNFFRVFKRRHGTTPLRFRRDGVSAGGEGA